MKTINIRESLIEFDKQTDFKYTLTDLYEACRLDNKKKNQLVQYIDGKDVEGMSRLLSNESGVMTENVADDLTDEELNEWAPSHTDCPACGDTAFDTVSGRCTKCSYRESLTEWYDDDDYLSCAIDSTMHSGKLLNARWVDNHEVRYLRNDRYEVKHKVNGTRIIVEFDTSDKSDSTLRFTVDGKSFVARYPNEAQDIIIGELDKKNLKQFDVVVEGLKAGDTVFVKPNKKLGKVKSIKGDYVEVEVMGGEDPDRIDTYYTSDLELQDSLDEEMLNEGPGAVLGDLAGKAVGDAWKGIKNFAKGVKDTAKDVAKTTKAVAKSAKDDWKQSKTRAKVVDAARAIKDAENVDDFKAKYQQRQDGRKLSDKARTQSYKGKLGKAIGDMQDWKFEVNGKKMNYDQFMKLPQKNREYMIKNKTVKCYDLMGKPITVQDQAKRLSGLKEALLLEYSEYRRILKEASAVLDRPRVSNVHTHTGSFSGIIDSHMDEINDMIDANVPATHIVHYLRDWVSEAGLTKSNAKYAQSAMIRMANMRTAKEVGMYLYNIRLKAEDNSFGSIDSQLYSKKHKYEDLNEALLVESAEEEDKPFTHSQIFDELKRETANFSIGTDRGIYSFEKEVKMAEKILKKHYNEVKVTERGNDFMVEFSGPKNKKKKVNESVQDRAKLVDQLQNMIRTASDKDYKYLSSQINKYSSTSDKRGQELDGISTDNLSRIIDDYLNHVAPKKVNESRVYLREPVGRFRLEVWVPGSGGDDDRERFIMASNNLQDIIDRAYDMDLDHDEAFYLRDMKGIYPYDLDQCYDAEELEDAIYNEWHYNPQADMRKQLGKMLLPQNESKSINEGKVALRESSQGKMQCISNSLNVSDFTDNDKIVFTDNGAYDLEKQGISGVYLWVGYNHGRSGRTNQKLGSEAINVAYDVKEYLEKAHGSKATVENRLSTTDMCRVWIANAGKPEEERVSLKESLIDIDSLKLVTDGPEKDESNDCTKQFFDVNDGQGRYLATISVIYDDYNDCAETYRIDAELDDDAVNAHLNTDGYVITRKEFDMCSGTESMGDVVLEIFKDKLQTWQESHPANESLTEQMTYTDTNGFLGEPGEKYTMSQFRRMWQDKDNDPVMSGYDSFEEWVGETISQMDAHEDGVAPSGRGKLSCAIFTDKSGIMGTAGEKYTVNDLADYWEANRGSDPVLASYNGDWKKWLDDTIEQMEIEYDSCLFDESLTEDVKPNLYYHSASDKRKIPVFIKEVEPGKFKWEDESGQSDDWFETEEMAHEDFVEFIQGEIPDVVIEESINESKGLDTIKKLSSAGYTFDQVKSKFEKETGMNANDPSNKDALNDWMNTFADKADGVKKSFYNRVGEAFEHPQNKEPHWYLCKHGIGPGALPKGVNIVDTVDDEENSNRVYVALDKVLTTDELKQYEVKEAKPPKMMKESLDFFDTITVILDDDMWGGYSKEMEYKYNWYQGQVMFEGDPRLKEIGAKPGDTILCGLEHADKFGDDDIDFDIVPIKVLTEN